MEGSHLIPRKADSSPQMTEVSAELEMKYKRLDVRKLLPATVKEDRTRASEAACKVRDTASSGELVRIHLLSSIITF